MIQLPWEAGVPMALAIVGLITWLLRKVWAGHERELARVLEQAVRAEAVAHDRCNAIERRCNVERDHWQELETRTSVLTTELKAHRSEMKQALEHLSHRMADVQTMIKDGR